MLLKYLFHSKRLLYLAIAPIVGAALLLAAFLIFRQAAGPSLVGKNNDTMLTDYSGKSVRFEQYISGFNHKPLIVYFWATWCPYCAGEFNDLVTVQQQYGSHIEIVAVNRGESSADAKKFTDSLSIQSNILYLLDPTDALFKKMGGYAMPETIFINGRGEEIFHKHGPISPEEINDATIATLK